MPAEVPVPRCGHPPLAAGSDGPALAAAFPATMAVDAGEVRGTVSVTAGAAGVDAVSLAEAEVYLVHDGRTVTLPPPLDSLGLAVRLGPGATTTLPATLSLAPCDPRSGARLAPGRYDLHALVVLHGPGEGEVHAACGGPWRLRLR